MANEVYVGRIRSVVLLILLSLVTAGIYFFVWFYKANRDLQRHFQGRVNPGGRLALFLLLPIIGWFLAAYLTGRSVRRAQIHAGNDQQVVPLYGAIWAGLVPILGWAFCAGSYQRGLNRAWMSMGHVFDTLRESSVQCPDCDNVFATLFNPLAGRSIQCPRCGRVGDL